MKDNLEKIDQGLIAFEALKQKALAQGQKCQNISVDDDDALNVALQILGEANDVLKFIENKRKELKAPILDIGRQIDAKAKELTELLEPYILQGKESVKIYSNKKEQERQAELQRLKEEQEEQIRKEQERIAKIKDYLFKMQDDITSKTIACETVVACDNLYYSVNERYPHAELFNELAELSIELKEKCLKNILERKSFIQLRATASAEIDIVQIENAINYSIVENANNVIDDIEKTEALPTDNIKDIIAKETELQSSKLKNTRFVWKWEIVDYSQIPEEFKQINKDAVNDFMSEHKETLTNNVVLKGIRFYQDAVIVLK